MDTIETSHRYSIIDSYIIEEIRARYINGSRDERIHLLQQVMDASLFSYPEIPYEIALLAVNDPNPVIRGWLAKNAHSLDYRERIYDKNQPTNAPEQYLYPDRNLWDALKQDKDLFVRLSVHENSCAPGYAFIIRDEYFQSLTQVERLAVIRNSHISVGSDYIDPIVFKIFDVTDKSLVLSENERTELSLAFLSVYINVQNRDERMAMISKVHKRLWQLIMSLSAGQVKSFAYRYLVGKDEWKAKVYQSEESAWLRRDLLINTKPSDYKTLRLALEDDDETCCNLANEKYSEPVKQSNKYWRFIKHFWTGFVNLITLVIVFSLFSVTRTSFERLVIAVLGYIFTYMMSFNMSSARFFQILTINLESEFRRLRKLTGEQLSTSQEHEEAIKDKENNLEFSKNTIDYYINLSFQTLMSLVVLYYLLSVLF